MSVLDKALRVGEGKQLRRLKEVAEAVNNLEDKITSLSDEDLRGKTADFKKRIENGESLDSIMPEAFAVMREASNRVLGQRHFDVQLMGGAALHWGNIAEMKTGEGRRLSRRFQVILTLWKAREFTSLPSMIILPDTSQNSWVEFSAFWA